MHVNNKQMKTGVGILILDKIDFRERNITRDKGCLHTGAPENFWAWIYVHYFHHGISFMVNQSKLLNFTFLICTLFINYILINLLPTTKKEIDGRSSML